MTQKLFFNPDQSLTLAGYAELQRLLIQYCNQAQFPPWNRASKDLSPEASKQWRDGFRAFLGECLQAKVWTQHAHTQKGQPMMRLFMSEGEAQAHQLRRSKPMRHAWSLEVQEHPIWIPAWKLWQDAPIQAALLQDVLTHETSFDALRDRLATFAVALYSPQDWQALRDQFGDALGMVWTDMNSQHNDVALATVPWQALQKFPGFQTSEGNAQEGDGGLAIILPSEWYAFGALRKSLGKGQGTQGHELDVDPHDMFAFYQQDMRYRFAQILQPVQLAGAMPMACAQVLAGPSYAYLNLYYCHTGFYEASQEPLAQDKHGDWVCDLVTHGDEKLNLKDHVVLAGSLGRWGCLVKSKSSAARLLDWLPLDFGEHHREHWPDIAARANPRWAAVRASSEGLRLVQHVDTLLWGWVDKAGQISIQPSFAKISGFCDGIARASEPDRPELWGLINTSGQWMLPPEWLEIDWRSPQFITVQSQSKEWGALGFRMQGRREPVGAVRIIVPMQSEQAWLEAYEAQNVLIRNGSNSHARVRLNWFGSQDDLSTQEKIKEAIERAGQKGAASLVSLAKEDADLSSLAGQFAGLRETDLRQAGLWGLRVRVLKEQGGIFKIKAGDIGHIGCNYPVSLSDFDLMQEAPVMDLPSASHAAIGITWQHLCFAAGKAA